MTDLDRYTCEQTFRRLSDYVDRALSAEEIRLVQAHLAICTQCAEEFAFEAEVIQTVRLRLQRIELPMESLRQKVDQALARAKRTPAAEDTADLS